MSKLSGQPAGLSDSSALAQGMRLLARELATTALDFFFPPRCIQCKRVGSLLCADCQAMYPPPAPLIERGSVLTECRATAYFDGAIREAIHALKYKNQQRFAEPLGQRLATELQRSSWNITLVAASPLHRARLQSRGYNQSALLAKRLSQSTGLPFNPEIIWKTRDTQAQVGLNAQERQLNVKGAFQASSLASGQHVLIIDDVYTTGATLRECASALLEAGARQVCALTVASARHHNADVLPIDQ